MIQMRNSIHYIEFLIILSLLFSLSSAADAEFRQCNCDGGDHGSAWSVEAILRWQKAGDFMIAAAYFSIPLELLYFVTCSDLFPFKWIVMQFMAFIVLCGLTHLLNVFAYGPPPHSFLLVLGVTVSKFSTALVSFLTAITLLTLIPQLLRVKLRESFLRRKARDLGREVGLMKRQEEAGWHVRMLTREIRKSLDRHTILYTTLVELSNTLALLNCAVWMPNEADTALTLTHQLSGTNSSPSIPIDDPHVVRVRNADGARLLNSDSLLGSSSRGGEHESGPVAAVRMPMLKVSDFKGGTPEVIGACYAILVLVLPKDGSRAWTQNELDIVAVVADQVAVALFHASLLEESQSMRDKLAQRNRVLLRAKQNLFMANDARNAFQRAMSRGMRMPIHSILSLLSIMQEESLGPEQRLAVDATARTGTAVSTLINDAMDISVANTGEQQFALEMSSFPLKSLVKEAATVASCLCDSSGLGFRVQVENSISERVVGDERRIFHVILHMVGNILHSREQGFLTFRVRTDKEAEELQGLRWAQPRRTNSSGGYAIVKFEIGIERSQDPDSISSIPLAKPPNSEGFDMGLSFGMCKRLVQLMQGNICAVLNSRGQPESMTLVLRLQLQTAASVDRNHLSSSSSSLIRGLRVLLTDEDGVTRTVTRKLLEKLGCSVCTAASAAQCLSALGTSVAPFQLVILDLDFLNQISGLELGLAIRKFRSGSWPLIVGLTAGAKEDAWAKCIQSGMSGLIRKPVLLRAVKEELIRVLQNT